MCCYLCIGFIDFMLANKTLLDYTSLFSPYDFKKNDDIILSYFKKLNTYKVCLRIYFLFPILNLFFS